MKRAAIGLAILGLAACGSRTSLKTYRVPSSAMEPTLHCAESPGCEGRVDDRVRVRPTKDVRRGDIVVFKAPPLALERCGAGGTFVKRVVAVPGETWAERRGVVYVDGRRLAEAYVEQSRRDSETHRRVSLGNDEFFLLGDNRPLSCDSRIWGPVSRGEIIGKVVEIVRGSKKIRVR